MSILPSPMYPRPLRILELAGLFITARCFNITNTYNATTLWNATFILNQSTWPNLQHTSFNFTILLAAFAVQTHSKTILRTVSKTTLEPFDETVHSVNIVIDMQTLLCEPNYYPVTSNVHMHATMNRNNTARPRVYISIVGKCTLRPNVNVQLVETFLSNSPICLARC